MSDEQDLKAIHKETRLIANLLIGLVFVVVIGVLLFFVARMYL